MFAKLWHLPYESESSTYRRRITHAGNSVVLDDEVTKVLPRLIFGHLPFTTENGTNL